MYQDQAAPTGAAWSGSTLFVMKAYKTFQQTIKADDCLIFSGEGSPSNLHLNSHWDFLPGNENLEEPKYVILDYIHHFLPKAKIIIIFRDPIDR